jgi:hypothetical protein
VIWEKNTPSTSGETPQRMVLANDGRIVVAGNTSKGFDGQAYAGEGDGYVSSWAADGSTHWTRIFGGFAYDQVGGLAVDTLGNVYVCGRVVGPIDSDNRAGGGTCGQWDSCGEPSSDPGPCADAYLIKFSPNGSKLWARQWGGDQDDGCNMLSIKASGAIVATGWYGGANYPALARFDANGNLLDLKVNPAFSLRPIRVAGTDDVFFNREVDIARFDPTGTTMLGTLPLASSQDTYVAGLALGPGGDRYVHGGGANYCQVTPAPPSSNGYDAFWAIFAP